MFQMIMSFLYPYFQNWLDMLFGESDSQGGECNAQYK